MNKGDPQYEQSPWKVLIEDFIFSNVNLPSDFTKN